MTMTTPDTLLDPLTNAPNAHYFEEHLALALGTAGRSQSRLCLAVIEIDELASLRTQHSTATVDACLQNAVLGLRQQLRSSDFLARTDDHQFSLVLPCIDSMTGLEHVADKLLGVVQQAFTPPAAVCIGLALYPDDATTPHELRQLAHAAVQTARSGGTGWSLP